MFCIEEQKQAMQCRDLFPVATKDERDENKDRVEPKLHVCWWVEVGGAATVTVVHPRLTVWGISIGFSSAVSCFSGEKAWSMVQNQGLREGELFGLVGRLMVGGGLGLLGWINTIDTKGLASRDLLFSSNLPSISLNPPTTTTSLARLCFIFCWGYKKGGWRQQNDFFTNM